MELFAIGVLIGGMLAAIWAAGNRDHEACRPAALFIDPPGVCVVFVREDKSHLNN